MALARCLVASARLAALLLAFSTAAPASAHFVLIAPDSATSQDPFGSPQKAPPCGEEAGGTANMKVTSFKPGDTISISINETIYHPGHYRVAVADTPEQLPPEPPVTKGSTDCGSVPIMSPAVFPVLGDGLLKHSAPFSGEQTMSVTLPPDFTCEKCTLQIIEFMSQHGLNNPGGCFYHHCATISVKGTASTPDAGTAADAGKGPPDASDSGSAADAGKPRNPALDASATAPEQAKTDASATKDASSPRKDAGDTTAAAASDDGCVLASGNAGGAWFSALALLALLRRRREQS
jgi:hypothetical protein